VPLSPETLETFQRAIREVHDCDSTYVESVPVHDEFQGKQVWEQIVHVFDLHGHPKAARAYVWAELLDEVSGRQAIKAVLRVDPVNSPLDAVRASIVHEYRKQEGESDG
jgi:hypothetical protein